MERYLPEGSLYATRENRRALRSPDGILQAAREGTILEGRAVMCDKDHHLHIDLGCMRGIIPRSECAIGIEEGEVGDIAILSRVNRYVMFKVSEVEMFGGQPFAVLSRRRVQQECLRQYIDRLIPGDVLPVRVTRLETFGAFCDIGAGICALLPIDCISVSRIPHPSARLKPGQHIRAVLKSRDEKGRITLTLKELLGTWEENAALFSPGQTVPGIVRSVEPYGIFIELMPNLAGLSEKVDGFCVGDQTGVFIKSINPAKMKVKLIVVGAVPSDAPPAELHYFFQGTHMDSFRYSPDICPREIITTFG